MARAAGGGGMNTEDLVAEYLAKGGKITKVPTGKSSFVYPVWDARQNQLRNCVPDSFKRGMTFGPGSASAARSAARVKRLKAVRDAFNPDETAQQLADRLGMTRDSVLRYLSELGLKSRVVPVGARSTITDAQIKEAWMSPMPWVPAAAAIGLKDRQQFRKRALALGLPERPSEHFTDWQERWDAVRNKWEVSA